MDMFFSWKRVWEYFPKVAAKFPVTINIVLVSFALALLLGVLIALIRIKRVPVLEQLTVIYISFIRGTPILVQLFIVYYGMPVLLNNVFHIDISHWNKMIYVYVAYGLNQSAFLAEIIRAAVHSVDIIQTEAG
jgi:L-cystine transport system permease protein